MADTSRVLLASFLLVFLALSLAPAHGHMGEDHSAHGAMHGAVEADRVLDNLTMAGNYSTLLSFLNNATYATALNLTDGKNKTVLAPTDAAFLALPAATAALLGNPAVVYQVLAYHILSAYVDKDTIEAAFISTEQLALPSSSSAPFSSIEGSTVNITVLNGTISANNATVVAADILADDATAVHGISAVLIPPNLDLNASLPNYASLTAPSPPPSKSVSSKRVMYSPLAGFAACLVILGAIV